MQCWQIHLILKVWLFWWELSIPLIHFKAADLMFAAETWWSSAALPGPRRTPDPRIWAPNPHGAASLFWAWRACGGLSNRLDCWHSSAVVEKDLFFLINKLNHLWILWIHTTSCAWASNRVSRGGSVQWKCVCFFNLQRLSVGEALRGGGTKASYHRDPAACWLKTPSNTLRLVGGPQLLFGDSWLFLADGVCGLWRWCGLIRPPEACQLKSSGKNNETVVGRRTAGFTRENDFFMKSDPEDEDSIHCRVMYGTFLISHHPTTSALMIAGLNVINYCCLIEKKRFMVLNESFCILRAWFYSSPSSPAFLVPSINIIDNKMVRKIHLFMFEIFSILFNPHWNNLTKKMKMKGRKTKYQRRSKTNTIISVWS